MTGRPDSTTLLDGEVSVNCGTRISVCESSEKYIYNHQDTGSRSICRISIDGKQSAEESELTLLQCELSRAQARIQELESSRNNLQEKLTVQSKQLIAFGLNGKFENLNLDNSNRIGALIRRYEYLYSQGNNQLMVRFNSCLYTPCAPL